MCKISSKAGYPDKAIVHFNFSEWIYYRIALKKSDKKSEPCVFLAKDYRTKKKNPSFNFTWSGVEIN